MWQDLNDAESSDELARYLDLKNLDGRVFMFEGVSAFNGSVEKLDFSQPAKLFEIIISPSIVVLYKTKFLWYLTLKFSWKWNWSNEMD